ncbi:hypothetical protein MASR2M50_11220 [Thauera sp.]
MPRGRRTSKPHGSVAAPAGALEEVGGRGERVGHAVDEVAAAIAVEVHRQAHEGRGHELGVAEGARPRAGEALGGDVALLQDLQRGEELAAEEGLPAPEAGQRGQRGEQRPAAEVAPVVALHAPHRDHRLGIDAVTTLDLGEHLLPLRQHRAPVGDTLLVHQRGEVVPDRGDEFGLGVEEADHRHVGGERSRVGVEGVAAHPLGRGLAAQLGEAGRERGLVGGGGEGQRKRRERGGEQEGAGSHGDGLSFDCGWAWQSSTAGKRVAAWRPAGGTMIG